MSAEELINGDIYNIALSLLYLFKSGLERLFILDRILVAFDADILSLFRRYYTLQYGVGVRRAVQSRYALSLGQYQLDKIYLLKAGCIAGYSGNVASGSFVTLDQSDFIGTVYRAENYRYIFCNSSSGLGSIASDSIKQITAVLYQSLDLFTAKILVIFNYIYYLNLIQYAASVELGYKALITVLAGVAQAVLDDTYLIQLYRLSIRLSLGRGDFAVCRVRIGAVIAAVLGFQKEEHYRAYNQRDENDTDQYCQMLLHADLLVAEIILNHPLFE